MAPGRGPAEVEATLRELMKLAEVVEAGDEGMKCPREEVQFLVEVATTYLQRSRNDYKYNLYNYK